MPSTKVNVAEVLDEIQLADLNPDTRDATIQKSLETLRDIFISRAVLDVSKIGVDIRELMMEYHPTTEIHQLAWSLLKTWKTTTLELRPSVDAPAVGYWHATGGVAEEEMWRRVTDEEMWQWTVTLDEAQMERALMKAKTTVDDSWRRNELRKTDLGKSEIISLLVLDELRKSGIETWQSAERMQAFLQEMSAVFPKKVVAEEKVENINDLLEKHREIVKALVQNKIIYPLFLRKPSFLRKLAELQKLADES